MTSGQDIRITDVPFSSVPDTNSTVFINDNGKLRQTDLTTIAKYSELYTAIIDAHNAGLQSLETTKAQLEQALVDLTNEKFEIINKDHAENLAELTALYENSMQNINALIENGHTKLLNDIEAVDDLRANAATICEEVFTKHTVIAPTIKGNMLLKNIQGDSYQKQLSGKNLFNINSSVSSSFNKSNNTLTNNITDARTNLFLYIEKFNDNTLVSVIVGVEIGSVGRKNYSFTKTSDFNRIRIKHNGSVEDIVLYVDVTNLQDDTVYTVSLDVIGRNPSVVGGLVLANIQIELGDTATDFEPYCGGIPSPNTEYPQKIESVGDSGRVVVKAVGKNLLNLTLGTTSKNGVTCTVNGDGTYTLNGTASAETIFRCGAVSVKKGNTYRINGCCSGGGENTYRLWCDSALAFPYGHRLYDVGNGLSVDALEDESFYINIQVFSGTACNNLIFKPMLVDANLYPDVTYDDFEPYTESTLTIPLTEPLRAIGDVKDEVVCKDGLYGVLRKVGIVKPTRYIGGSYKGVTNFLAFLANDAIKIPNSVVGDLMCDKIDNIRSADYQYSRNETCLSISDNGIVILEVEGVSTGEDMSTWISNNPIEIIYPLATPVFEPFADQTPFYNLMAMDEVTNISFVGESENVNPTATIRFPRNENGSLAMIAFCDGKKSEIGLEKCFQSVSDGKSLVASAITDKRVPTDATATFAEMAANIASIVLGSGNAVAANVLAGKTFTNDDGVEYTGTMPDLYNTSDITHTASNSTRVLLGDSAYAVTNSDGTDRAEIRYNGVEGFLKANTLFAVPLATMRTAVNTGTDAGAAHILSGKKAYNGATLVTGSMLNRGAVAVEWNRNNLWDCMANGKDQVYAIPSGYHNGNGYVKLLASEGAVIRNTYYDQGYNAGYAAGGGIKESEKKTASASASDWNTATASCVKSCAAGTWIVGVVAKGDSPTSMKTSCSPVTETYAEVEGKYAGAGFYRVELTDTTNVTASGLAGSNSDFGSYTTVTAVFIKVK